MNLNEQLKRLSDYKVGFNIYEGTIIISVVYPDTWTVLETKNESIQTTKDAGRTYYWVNMEVNVDEIFHLIDETIAYNREIEEKAELFKVMIAKLQQVFIDNDLDSLRNLEFTVKKNEERKKRRPRKRKKEEPLVNKETTNNAVVSVDEENLAPENVVNDGLEPQETEEKNIIDVKIANAIKEKEEG